MVFASAMIGAAHESSEFAGHVVIMALGMDSARQLLADAPGPNYLGMLEQGGRERAIAAVTVESHVVRFGGERSERAGRVLNGREALGLADPVLRPNGLSRQSLITDVVLAQ